MRSSECKNVTHIRRSSQGHVYSDDTPTTHLRCYKCFNVGRRVRDKRIVEVNDVKLLRNLKIFGKKKSFHAGVTNFEFCDLFLG